MSRCHEDADPRLVCRDTALAAPPMPHRARKSGRPISVAEYKGQHPCKTDTSRDGWRCPAVGRRRVLRRLQMLAEIACDCPVLSCRLCYRRVPGRGSHTQTWGPPGLGAASQALRSAGSQGKKASGLGPPGAAEGFMDDGSGAGGVAGYAALAPRWENTRNRGNSSILPRGMAARRRDENDASGNGSGILGSGGPVSTCPDVAR